MEAAMLIRTGSGSMHSPISCDREPAAVSFFGRSRSSGSLCSSLPRIVHFDRKSSSEHSPPLRRSRSDATTDRSVHWSTKIPREEVNKDLAVDSALIRRSKCLRVGISERTAVIQEEVELDGGGAGRGTRIGGGGRGGSSSGSGGEQSEGIGAYYKEMLRSDPENPLLLRNYGKFLQEVEANVEGAEECYGRAILANPGDGELLSLYGKLMWDTYRDEERAEVYYQRAIESSPDDSYVLGSYAHFLWDAEEEEEAEESLTAASSSSSTTANGEMVNAF